MTVISVEHVSKQYRLGMIGGRMLYEDISRWWARVRHRPDPLGVVGPRYHPRRLGDRFWALDDVSFAVEEGEVLGLIGRNGAGKSTLLKIMSQVTAPTSGLISIRGRVASLLEVGTGFHPALTGRENVFLNGAILGMSKAEIRKKFDEIVAFSECEDFIDTPVRRYSSGMYVRLAFAVAAHLESEILIVDEVLAVGDAQFQKKCLGKMRDVARGGGRTVLFVSHNMGAVRALCTRCVFLTQGQVGLVDQTEKAIDAYLRTAGSRVSSWARSQPVPKEPGGFLSAIEVRDADGRPADVLDSQKGFTVRVELDVPVRARQNQVAIRFTNQEGVVVLTTTDSDERAALTDRTPGRYALAVEVPGGLLAPGRYALLVASHVPGKVLYDSVSEGLTIEIEDVDMRAGLLRDGRLGVVRPVLHWSENGA
jgi:lipopolysaccharide transport system ATP-binding protein